MSQILTVGVEQAIAGIDNAADLAVKAISGGADIGISSVRTLVEIGQETGQNLVDLNGKVAADALDELEDERTMLEAAIQKWRKHATEVLGSILTDAADKIPVG